MSATVAVVVATHDRAERLQALLAGLRAQTIGAGAFRTIVVDDGSTDTTPAVLAEELARGELDLDVITRAHAEGPSVARDDGWRRTDADLIAFTDDDCEPEPDWLAQLLAAHEAAPEAILQGRTEPIERERHLLAGPNARTQVVRRAGPYFQCCNIAYPRTWLERVDGFDRSWGWGGEDADLAWRVIEAGAEVRFAVDALVHHAVTLLGPGALLRMARVWSDSMRLYARHPRMRDEGLVFRLFWRPSHLLLLQALIGAGLSRRHPAFLLLAWPYLRHLEERWGDAPEWAALLAASDVIEVASIVRGAAKHRTLVL